ncbi:MAG: alpha/beta hydrolase, partial [Pseudomonadota bacterium]
LALAQRLLLIATALQCTRLPDKDVWTKEFGHIHNQLSPVKRHSFMAELIPNAELRVIEGAGHLPTLEKPDQTTNALRDWLKLPFVLR